jgi:TonB-dependent starch-binding outer membrane protein SusC
LKFKKLLTKTKQNNMKRIYLIFFVILCFLGNSLSAQTFRVTGTVTSAEDGSSLPGVTVAVEGTTQGTVTDINGQYELTASSDATLVFSFIGRVTQTVAVQGRNIINMALEPEVALLEEFVVVGYGSRLRSELTGSISTIKAAEMENLTQPSFESALQGRAAGVYVQGGSGKLGQAVKVRVRGSASLSASNQPLYVVDGFPVQNDNLGDASNEPTNPLADINPADIQSVEILKDASAAAMFGARAANGVILITTKRGTEGKPRINFTAQRGFAEPANKVKYLNREQYLELFAEAYNNVADETGFYEGFESFEDALDWRLPLWREGSDTNWEDQALRQGSIAQYDLSAQGGTGGTRFFTSLSFANQDAVVIGNEYDRVAGRLNLDQKFSDKLSFGMNLNVTRSRNFRVSNDNAFASPLQMVALPPMDPTHDPETGELNRKTLYENGLVVRQNTDNSTEIFRNVGSFFGQYHILPELTLRSEWSVDVLNQREIEYWGRLTQTGGPDGYGYDRTVTSKNYSTNNYLTYNLITDIGLDAEIVAGMSMQEHFIDFSSIAARSFPNDQFKRIASASEITSASTSGTGRSFSSYFSRANLKILDKYLLTLSGRYDGSSRFGADNRFGFFPAVSAGWIITNEDFLADNSTLSFLKLRTSYGLTGNAEIGDFNSRGLYAGSNYAGLAGMIPSSIPSPDLKWETTAQIDVGIDFGFINNRITGEIGYYEKKTDDLLLNVNVPATTGFTSVTRNVGSMENKGWEFALNTVNIDGDFRWETNFNISTNKNLVTDLDGQIITSGFYRAVEGEPIGIMWMPVFAGVDPENGDALFYVDDTRDETTTSLSAAAPQKAGDPNPDFLGGITNSFRYGGFDLSFMVQFVVGNDIFNRGRQWQADGFSWFDNQVLEVYENRWRQPGDNTHIPQPRFFEGNGYGVSSMLVFDGSYARLKDVTLGYTLPKNLLNPMGVESLRIFVKGLNLLTFTDYPGWDPETNFVGTGPTSQQINLQQGFDFYTAPQPRTVTFGLTLGF